MKSYKGIIILVFTSFNLFAQNILKKVEFTGAARSEMTQFDFRTSAEDTVTPRKKSSGYALIDLGFKINPNNSTEILGMLRINNAFGGFWGSGVTFDVRQLYLRGVVSNALRYQLGNIDYKLTPYTFFNYNSDQLIAPNSIQKIKRDIVNYETFYNNNNTWRQQGAAIDFGFEFAKIIKEIKINSFITRLNPSTSAVTFERFYGGGNLILKQSKYLILGFNQVSAFDLVGSSTTKQAFRNNVSTLTYKLNLDQTNYSLGLAGESGVSSHFYTQDTTRTLNDYFVDVNLFYKHKKSNLNVELGYMNVGPDFRSIGAQSKRIDYTRQDNVYNYYTNNLTVRPVSSFDIIRNPLLYNAGLSQKIMQYSPIYNNVLPYGKATFNRSGLYFTVNYEDKKQIFKANLESYFLSEIRGQGTEKLKKFALIKGDIRFDISKIFNWNKELSLNVGAALQNTKRVSDIDYEKINLQSLNLSAGLDFEIVKQFYILTGLNMFNTSGNELMPTRDGDDKIVDYMAFKVKGVESIYSTGLKFEFSKKIFIAVLYDSFKFDYESIDSYKLNQLLIVYNMKF